MSKNKKEIIDNEDGTMAEFLKNALQDNRGQVSIATGYFNVEGYADLRDPLREAAKKNDFHLRLLIGNEAVVREHELDGSAEGWSDHERREWLAAFWGELARYLAKWQDIKMRWGPGENVTFEKAVSR